MFRPGSPEVGIINDHGIGQSEFLWYIRANPNVKKIFSSIWNSNELCVSFDGAGCYRNWHRNAQWKTQSGWYHCDQVPSSVLLLLLIKSLINCRIHFVNLLVVQYKV